ncbi:tudor domain-containing 6 isoform X2 [Betta splendens]|uniref:Tudor domain-containing 6 isoform X2 n=1 Tax=Betta splendens TaxID=158456 RepID=A0A6P7LMG9_BETSP|nr:tudor domain-containing 6 isoform X2 [Betta splendens]
MCSIPGLPTPGSEVPVLLRRVNLNPEFGFVELWVHIDDGMMHIYEQLRHEIQIQNPERKLNGSEGKPGDFCLVCISDTWHRARIVSIHSETYNVFLIDQGQSHTATSETLACGNTDFFLLPPEVESCILANVLSPVWSEKATKSQLKLSSFLKSLPGKKFKGVVQHVLMPHRTIVLDIPVLSKVMCKYGVSKNIPGDDFKSFVLKYLSSLKEAAPDGRHIMHQQNDGFQLQKREQYFHPELLTGISETVTVTEIIDPNNIFCTLNIFAKALQSLSEHIHQHYETRSDPEDSPPLTCGDPCAAKGGNGRWRRSSLKSTTAISDAVEVLHVDVGMTEMVPVRDIRPLHGEFIRMPVVTYLCSLDGVKDDRTGWATDQTNRLKSLLLNQTVVARFNHYNASQDLYYVTLFDANGACMTDGFMEEKEPLAPDVSQQGSNVQKAPSSALVGPVSSEIDDNLQEELLLSTKNPGLKGEMDVSMSGSNGSHINESSEHSHALSCNDGHPSAGFPNNYSTNNMEVGDREKVMVTFAETVHHFYGQLERNSHLLNEVVENVSQLISQPPSTDHPLGLGSVCFARYSDGQWYRGQIVEVCPRLKVHLVDYGDTIVANESDLRPFPPEPCVARSVPVLAVPLGLFDVPVDVPQEVNQWFACRATDHSLTLSVVAKDTQGKLIVELFDTSVNVNAKVRERILKMTPTQINGLNQQSDRRLSESSEQGCVPNEDLTAQELKTVEVLTKSTELNKLCDTEDLQTSPQVVPEAEVENEDCAGDGETSDAVLGDKRNSSEEVYASSIAGPHYFWCQFANTEEHLNTLSRLAQEAGKAPNDAAFPRTLGSGCLCLALFSEDHQWYRGQVTQKDGNTLHVLFVDYGNEADVGVEDVRPLPQALLELAPQAFLCSLHGFDETKGSWSDEAYDDFYSLLVDKTLRVTVVNTKDYSEFAVPQYVVQIESENVVVNDAMQKYWIAAEPGQVGTASPERKSSLQPSHTEVDTTIHNVSEGNCDIIKYQKPEISTNQTETVSASCIAEPSFFWCQYTNTDVLSKVLLLAQEAGKAPKDSAFLETLGPGCPCLALFSEDHQWHRVQVTQKDGDTLHVLFVDYGNEADIDVENVRPLPQSLLELAPQAFLCSLHGFDETKGSWSDKAYDDFYSLLFSVEIDCEGVVVNTLMEKYWKELDMH